MLILQRVQLVFNCPVAIPLTSVLDSWDRISAGGKEQLSDQLERCELSHAEHAIRDTKDYQLEGRSRLPWLFVRQRCAITGEQLDPTS